MSRGKTCLLVATGAGLILLSACGWGSEKVRQRIVQLNPKQVVEATIDLDRCPGAPMKVSATTLAELLSQTAALIPAQDIGYQEEWKEWRSVVLKLESNEDIKISVATRESLHGVPIVILKERPTGGIGFYAGEQFWQWLRSTPESVALAAEGAEVEPCK